MEVVEFATGAPELLKGDFSENVGTRVDSYRSVSRWASSPESHRSIPGDGPDVDVPCRIGVGNCFILKPSERDPPRH